MLTVAVSMFMQHGYHVSMDSIAAKAKVAKQTVYNHFGNKQSLFAEVMRSLADPILVSLDDSDLDVRSALLQFSLRLRQRALSAEGIGIYRALIAEAPRFPGLARLIYARGYAAALAALERFFRRRRRRGEVSGIEPARAARVFLGMLLGHDRARLLYGLRLEHTSAREAAVCGQIVDCFLRGAIRAA
jgi:TetR/AcrR family transcriptional repressor of mexJK operon